MTRDNLYRWFGFVGFLILLPLLMQMGWMNSYWLSVFVFIGIYCLITIGLSLLMGYAGQISLGHGAFFGLGAYTSAILTTHLGVNSWLAIVAAIGLTSLVALVIGIPSLRLHGHYLAMATLAIGEILVIIFTAEGDLTGGPSGMGGVPYLTLFGWKLNTDFRFYIFIWTVVVIVLLLCLNIIHSRVGRALRSIHGGELAANSMGVNTTVYKVQVFVLSAALASLAGCFFVHYMTFISPVSCSLKFSVMLVVMVAIGGMNNVWGAILGTFILNMLPEYLSDFGDYDILIYGLILMLIMIFLPDGLYGGIVKSIRTLQRLVFTLRVRSKTRVSS